MEGVTNEYFTRKLSKSESEIADRLITSFS